MILYRLCGLNTDLSPSYSSPSKCRIRAWGGHGSSRFEEADVTLGRASSEHGGLGHLYHGSFMGIFLLIIYKHFNWLVHLIKQFVRYKNKGNVQRQGSTRAGTLASPVVQETTSLSQKASSLGSSEAFDDSEASSTLNTPMIRAPTSPNDREKSLRSRYSSFDSVGSGSSLKNQGEKTPSLSKYYSSG